MVGVLPADSLKLSRESASAIVAGRMFHACLGLGVLLLQKAIKTEAGPIHISVPWNDTAGY